MRRALIVALVACRGGGEPPLRSVSLQDPLRRVAIDAGSSEPELRVLRFGTIPETGTVARRAVDADGHFRCVQDYHAEPHYNSAACPGPGYIIEASVVFDFAPSATTATRAFAKRPSFGRIERACTLAKHVDVDHRSIAKLIPDLAAAPTVTPPTEVGGCRDARLELALSPAIEHRVDGAIHVFTASADHARVALRLLGRDVADWSLGRKEDEQHCDGSPNVGWWTLALDVACAGDIAVVTSGVYRSERACNARDHRPLLPMHAAGCDLSVAGSRTGVVHHTRRIRVNLATGATTQLEPVSTPRLETSP
jgi:hypothetical protein